MSKYTQKDLERARKHNLHYPDYQADKTPCSECNPCGACARDAFLIASVRAEAQQARSSIVEDSLTEVIGDQANRYAARLAAAEKLATSIRELLDKSHYPLAERQARKNLSEWEEAAK